MNLVKDYNLYQGVYHPSDSHVARRSLNVRRVLIENTGSLEVSVRISSTMYGRKTNFSLGPGEGKFIGINPIGEGPQYITIHHPLTGERVSNPTPLSRDSNQFVIREGMNNYFIHKFYSASLNASH